MNQLLQDKVAIVTGGAAGIGAAIAQAYNDQGAKLVIADIDLAAAQKTAAALNDAIAVEIDVADEAQTIAMVEATVAAFGRIDIVVPNAGTATTTPLIETSFADWRKVMAVDLDGVFLTIRHSLPVMLEGGGGNIVNISSITGTTGTALVGSYAAAKAAVRSLTQTLSAEMRFHNIRANAILPGFIDTELVTSRQHAFEAALGLEAGKFGEFIATKQTRFGRTEEVAAAAVFFASDMSSWCNGSSLVLDGGFTASLL